MLAISLATWKLIFHAIFGNIHEILKFKTVPLPGVWLLVSDKPDQGYLVNVLSVPDKLSILPGRLYASFWRNDDQKSVIHYPVLFNSRVCAPPKKCLGEKNFPTAVGNTVLPWGDVYINGTLMCSLSPLEWLSLGGPVQLVWGVWGWCERYWFTIFGWEKK